MAYHSLISATAIRYHQVMTYNEFVVDVETTGNTPFTSVELSDGTIASAVMTELGCAHVDSGKALYLHLYDFIPHPDNPALPVAVAASPGVPQANVYSQEVSEADLLASEHTSFSQMTVPSTPLPSLEVAAEVLTAWVAHQSDSQYNILISDNNEFDGMWTKCFLAQHGQPQVFGHSSRRIGDFAAGQLGQWSKPSIWKSKVRRGAGVPHTHNPADDALGNTRALRFLRTKNYDAPGTLPSSQK